MVGQGVLRQCLLDPEVGRVVTVGRTATGEKHPKLEEIVHADLYDLSPIESKLAGLDACFFCLGVTSAGMTEEAYTRVTYDRRAVAGAGDEGHQPGGVAGPPPPRDRRAPLNKSSTTPQDAHAPPAAPWRA